MARVLESFYDYVFKVTRDRCAMKITKKNEEKRPGKRVGGPVV